MGGILYLIFAIISWPICFRMVMHWTASDFYSVDNGDIGFGLFISILCAAMWPLTIVAVIGVLLLMPQKAKEKYRS